MDSNPRRNNESARKIRWQSRQLHPGTRIIHYRCCLPALAGFANYRRGRTNGTAIKLGERTVVRTSCASPFGRLRFTNRLPAELSNPSFQFSRVRFPPSIVITIISGGESGIRTREAVLSRLHTFQACSFNHSDTSPKRLRRIQDAAASNKLIPAGDGCVVRMQPA